MVKCEICGEKFKSLSSLASHVIVHKISVKNYYDKYICGRSECLQCGEKTSFMGMKTGYKKFCTHKCSTSYSRGKKKNKNIITSKNLKCEICEKTVKNLNGLSKHIPIHNITSEQYYLKFIGNKQKCEECGGDTKFKNLVNGYQKFCSLKCSNNNEERIQKFKNSYLLNNNMTEVKEKRYKTNLELYGNEIANRNEEIKKRNTEAFLNRQVYKKIKLLEELDLEVINPQLHSSTITTELKFKCKKCNKIFIDTIFNITQRIYKCSCQRPKTGSINENKVKDFISEILVDEELVFNKKIDGYEFDILIPNKKVAIEYNGLYWHSEQILKNPVNYHLNKKQICNKYNIKLIQIFEDEWIEKNEIVKNRLSYLLGICKNKIYARNCLVKNISYIDKKTFLNEYHIQGDYSSSVNIGAYYNNELVAVMTFSKGNISKGSHYIQDNWELSRYCCKFNIVVIGIASKLLSYFKKNYSWKYIYSYADARWSDGFLYSKLGFSFEYMTDPNYWYTKDGFKRINRFNLRKRPEEPKDIPEWVLREKEGYYKIWDCGNYKFSMKKEESF